MTAVATDSIVFAVTDDLTSDMVCEVKQREEARKWEPLKPCPCCGSEAKVHNNPGMVQIGCSARLYCRLVTGKDLTEATWMWNHDGRGSGG